MNRKTRSQSSKQASELSEKTNKEVADLSMEVEVCTEDAMKRYFDSKFDKLFQEMATKESIDQLLKSIAVHQEQITQLESKVVVMDSLITRLNQKCEDQEQYQRRLCLRINGIPAPPEGQHETADDCLQKVKAIFEDDLALNIPDEVIDRAHRIGKVTKIGAKKFRQVIVKFTTWRHRSEVYKARKKAQHLRIKLDLTQFRVNTIEKANQILRPKGDKFYAFADINCRICARLGEVFYYFSNVDDLIAKLGHNDHLESSLLSESETY